MHDREHIKRSRLDLSSIQIEENGIRYEFSLKRHFSFYDGRSIDKTSATVICDRNRLPHPQPSCSAGYA